MSESPIPPLSHSPIPSSSAQSSDRVRQAQPGESYSRLPLSFEENQGQVDGKVKFLSRGNGYTLFLTSTEVLLSLSAQSAKTTSRLRLSKTNGAVLRMKLIGANPEPQIAGVEELPGKSNYFIGNDPAKWRTNVATYARVKYRDVYPGIDLVYYGNQKQLEYDWIVAPGAEPEVIKFAIEGARRTKVDSNGDLVLAVAGGEVRLNRPLVYQVNNGVRREIAAGYVPKNSGEIGFRIAEYDPARPLVIDPVLIYSTYLGGSGNDHGYGIAVDSAGNAYVTGDTGSLNFPTANPRQPTHAGGVDAFVAKFNPSGSALVYSTYHGGNDEDRAHAIAVDVSGNLYVTGYTASTNFPSANPLQSAYGGFFDAFVTKFNPSGSALVYSTYHGGSDVDYGLGIAVDYSGNAYVTGFTRSTNFPTANPLQPTIGGGGNADAFVTKFNPSGSALVYSTYHGGSGGDAGSNTGGDSGSDIAVDSLGNVYVTGSTTSTNFPTANPRQPAYAGGFYSGGSGDAFVTKFNPSGSALVYSTYHGGSDGDGGSGIAVDSLGNVYVTGHTSSINFPTDNPLQSVYGGVGDVFVTKFNPSGSTLVYSTYHGGSGIDGGTDIAVDSAGNAYVTGTTTSTNFPTANPLRPVYSGNADAFIMKIGEAVLAFFPQVAAGGGFSTIFTVVNTGATAATGNLILTDQQGSTWTVNGVRSDTTANPQSAPTAGRINITASSFPISIPSGGITFLAASALNPADATKSGWARLETSGGSVTGVATFRLVVNGVLESIAGVLASQHLQYATIPVDNDDSENRYTGYAIANPGLQSVSIKLATVNQSGNLVDDSVVIPLGAGQQTARFLHQDLPARLKFQGSIVLRGQSGRTFVVVALVQNQGRLTVIPVNPEKAPHIPN